MHAGTYLKEDAGAVNGSSMGVRVRKRFDGYQNAAMNQASDKTTGGIHADVPRELPCVMQLPAVFSHRCMLMETSILNLLPL